MAVRCASHVRALRHRAAARAPLAFRFRQFRQPIGRKMRQGAGLIRASRPDLEVDGEMQADTALTPRYASASSGLDIERTGEHPHHAQSGCGEHRLPVYQGAGRCAAVGPILIGAAKPPMC